MHGDGGPGKGDRTPSGPSEGVELGDLGLDVPNCPSCLHRMDAAETREGGVHWACPACGYRAIA